LKRTDADQTPILERIKTIVPPAGDIARTLKIEHETAERIHRLMLVTHAGLVELAEEANQTVTDSVAIAEDASQAVLDSTDSLAAQATLVSSQRVSMDAMENFADRQAGAQTVIQNQDVWLANDAASIRHVLEIVNLSKIIEAARPMKRSRIAEIIDALLKAVE
jgi:hypothetical protein